EVPLYNSFNLRIKPNKTISDQLKNKLVFVCKSSSGKRLSVTPAQWKEGWVQAKVRSFGDYSIQADTQAPSIRAVNIHNGSNLAHAKNITFKISDSKSGIADYRAELDGKWLMFARKGNTIFYTFD